MAEVFLDAVPMAQQGYCCSQILLKLILDVHGEENPGLMRALHGLCKGMAGRHGACGLLTGGMCAISYVVGKGGEDETAHVMAEEMRYDFLKWFRELTRECGGTDCIFILNDKSDNYDLHCNELLGQCWYKILEIFDEYDIDWSIPRSITGR